MKNLILFFLLTNNFIFGQDFLEGKFSSKHNLFQQKKVDYWISEFEGNFAKFSKTGYSGIINKQGEIILPMEYDEIYSSDSLFYAYKKNTHYIFSKRGKIIDVPIYDYIIKKKGILYLENYQLYRPLNISGNPFEKKRMFQYGNAIYDFDGYLITNVPDNLIINFHYGMSVVNNGQWKHKKYGYINRKGENVIPMEYDYCDIFRNGRGIMTLNNKRAVIDKFGNFIVPFTKSIPPLSFYANGLCRYKDSITRKLAYIDTSGNIIIPPKFDKAGNFSNGFAKVEENGKSYTIDVNGKKYKTEQGAFKEGYRFQDYKNKIVYEDKNKKEVFDFKYQNHPTSIYFIEGLAKVKLNGKEGVIDRLGNEIIPPVYDRVKIDQGYILVKNQNDIWLMSKSGKKLKTVQETTEKNDTKSTNHSISIGFNVNGFLMTRKDDKIGVINSNADVVLPITFDRIYLNEYYIIAIVNNKTGVYNFNGELMVPHEEQKIVSKTNKGFIIKREKTLVAFDREFNLQCTIDSIDINYPSAGTQYPSGVYPYKNKTTGKLGYLDIINIQNSHAIYDDLGFYGNHLILCKNKNKKILYKPISNEKVHLDFDIIQKVTSNILIVRKERDGPRAALPEGMNSYMMNKDWVYGIMNQDGEIILPIKYSKIRGINFFRDKKTDIPKGAFMFIEHKNEYIFIDNYGKIML